MITIDYWTISKIVNKFGNRCPYEVSSDSRSAIKKCKAADKVAKFQYVHGKEICVTLQLTADEINAVL